MKRLIILPVSPLGKGGYNIAVNDDVKRLGGINPEHDHVIIYPHPNQPNPEHCVLLPRPSKTSPRRYINLLRLRTSTETTASELRSVIGDTDFDEIFCGEVSFYRGLKSLFPNKRITVRFHNLFCLPRVRQSFYQYNIGTVFKLNLELFSRLEREILRDPLVDPILIAEAEKDFLKLQYPTREIKIWNPPIEIKKERPAPSTPRIAYMGSLAAHQKFGMEYFVRKVLPAIRARRKDIEFHMFGSGSKSWNDPANGVIGHGFYDGDGLPLDGDALFACPDLLGGGIKIKVGDWLNWGLPIIATPFALDGYQLPPLDNMITAEIDDWPEAIVNYFDGL